MLAARLWPALLFASFLFVGPWLTIAVDYGVASSHLRVSIRRDSLQDAPSCQHRIAQVELLNVHTSEDVVIHSIRTLDESTEEIDDERVDDDGRRFDDLPRQVYASKLPNESLRLGPGQVVIVPIAFLPRFPQLAAAEYDANRRLDELCGQSTAMSHINDESLSSSSPNTASSASSKRIPRASPFQEADWWDLLLEVGDSPLSKASSPPLTYRRSNWDVASSASPQPTTHSSSSNSNARSSSHSSSSLTSLYRYQVSTEILVESNRGSMTLALAMTSRRDNTFGLPDVIYFDTQQHDNDDETDVGQNQNSNDRETKSRAASSRTASQDKDKLSVRMNSEQFRNLNIDVKVEMGEIAKSMAAISNGGGPLSNNPLLASISFERLMPNGFEEELASLPHYDDNTIDQDDRDKKRGIAWIVDSQLPPERVFDRAQTTNVASETDPSASASQQQQTDCYDVYLRNPKNSAMKVMEVLLSKPDQMSLHIRHDKAKGSKLQSDSISPQRFINNWSAISSSSAVFGEAESALIIPAGSEAQYLVTVCAWLDQMPTEDPTLSSSQNDQNSPTNPQPEYSEDNMANMVDWVDAGEESKTLGLLQIRTTDESLFIGLEKADQSMARELRSLARGILPVASSCPGVDPNNSTRTDSTSSSSGFVARHRSGEGNVNLESSLRLTPANIEFNFVSSSVPFAFQEVDIHNVSPRPIAIMRASVALEQRQNKKKPELRWSSSDERKLLSKLGIEVVVQPLDESLSRPLAQTSFHPGAVTVACTIDWKKFRSQSRSKYSTTIRGALILRGTTRLDWAHSDWEKAFIMDSDADHNVVTEIPLVINILEGSFGFMLQSTTLPIPAFWSMKDYSNDLEVISSAFFPVHPLLTSVKVSSEEDGTVPTDFTKGVDVRIRLFSDFDKDVVVDKVAVVDGHGNAVDRDSLCGRFKAYKRELDGRVASGPGRLPKKLNDMGLLHLRYRFPTSDAFGKEDSWTSFNSSYTALPTTCYLRVTTQPEYGIQEVPLVVYSGMVDVSKNLSDSVEVSDQEAPTASNIEQWYHVVMGFDSLMDWFRNSKAGYALRSVLKASNSKPDRDGSILERYLYGLAPESVDRDSTKLSPILLKIGAIAQGETETIPLTFTNYNPVSVGIKIAVGEVEGQYITVGRDVSSGKGEGTSLVDLLPSTSSSADDVRIRFGRFRGHTVGGLRDFLSTSKLAVQYLNQYPYRNDISPSKNAFAMFPFLRKQFKSYAIGQFHRKAVPRRFDSAGWSRCDNAVHPPLYGPFQNKLTLPGRTIPGPIIISNDRKSVRSLSTCWDSEGEPLDMESDGTYVDVPPGGVVRFDVTIRSPPHHVLTKDITRFLATGLVLTTDHGEILPVLLSFEALQGKLDVSHIPSVYQQDRADGTIQLAAGLFARNSAIERTPIKVPPHGVRSFVDFARGERFVPRNASFGDRGISLFMKSSFLRDVHLRKVVSCNPWFAVDLANHTVDDDPFLGVNIGSVRSFISCDTIQGVHLGSQMFPSFFRCALSWLTQRSELQPRGCGILPNVELRKECKDTDYRCEKGGMDKMIRSLKRALLVSEWSDELASPGGDSALKVYPFAVKTGRRGVDGVASLTSIDAISSAWSALESATEAGLLSLGTSLRAVVQYNATPDELSPVKHNVMSLQESNHLLSVAIRNVSITTSLETPRLLKSSDSTRDKQQQSLFTPHFVSAQPTLVGHVSSVMLPLRNPSAVPIKVRLAVAPADHIRDDGSMRSRFLGSFQTPYVQTKRRVSHTPADHAHNNWWDRGGAFFLPDFHGDLIRSPYNITIKSQDGAKISLLNPSLLSNTAFLIGCGIRCGIRDENNNNRKSFEIPTLASKSLIGASSVAGASLASQGDALSDNGGRIETTAQTVFAGGSLMSGGKGPAAFAIPYSALDEVIVPPFGEVEMGPILFRPPGRFQEMGCEALKSNKKSETCDSQIFESIVFLENSLTGLERVILRGKALWEKVVFLDPLSSDGFSSIEQRNGFPTLVFPGYVRESSRSSSRVRSIKEVVVHNDGDVAVTVAKGYLSTTTKNGRKSHAKSSLPCEMNSFYVLGCRQREGLFPFTIAPGQNRSIYIEHEPKCTKRREYMMLHLDLESIDDGSKDSFGSLRWPFGSSLLHQSRARSIQVPSVGVELTIGYEMNDEEYKLCVPPSGSYTGREVGAHSSKDANTSTLSQLPEYNWLSHDQSTSQWIWYSLTVLFIAAWLFLLLQRLFWMLDAAKTFCGNLNFHQPVSSEATLTGQTWSAAFLCLARADPSSSDLQSLALERSRQIVLLRYKAMGVNPPLCFGANAVAERGIGTVASRRQVGSANRGPQPSNTDKIRTSDAIFGKLDTTPALDAGIFPIRLGWRTAATRGIVDASSLRSSAVVLKTEAFLRQSRDQPVPERIQAVTGRHISDETKSMGSSSDFGSSLGDLSDDEDDEDDDDEPVTTTTSHRPAIVVPDRIETAARSKSETAVTTIGDIRVELNAAKVEPKEQQVDSFPSVPSATKVDTIPSGSIVSNPDQDQVPQLEISRMEEGNEVTTKPAATPESTTQDSIPIPIPTVVETPKPPIPKPLIVQPVVESSRSKPHPKRDKVKPTAKAPPDDTPKLDALSKNGGTAQSSAPAKTAVTPKDSAVEIEQPTKPVDEKPEVEKADAKPKRTAKPPKPKREKGTKKKSKESKAKANSNRQQQSAPSEDNEELESSSSALIRPPPGLLPPPGFESSQSAGSYPFRSSTDLPFRPTSDLSVRTNDDLLLQTGNSMTSATDYRLVSANESNLSNSVLDDALLGSTRASATAAAIAAGTGLDQSDGSRERHAAGTGTVMDYGPMFATLLPALPSPQNGGSRDMADFDVMDFLDGILNDGGTYGDGDGTIDEATSNPLSMLGGAAAGGSDELTTPTHAVSSSSSSAIDTSSFPSNPWALDASSDGLLSSRAAAYGIAFEDNSERTNRISSTDAITIAATTADAIATISADPMDAVAPLMATSAVAFLPQDGENDKESSLFYASLLDE